MVVQLHTNVHQTTVGSVADDSYAILVQRQMHSGLCDSWTTGMRQSIPMWELASWT